MTGFKDTDTELQFYYKHLYNKHNWLIEHYKHKKSDHNLALYLHPSLRFL